MSAYLEFHLKGNRRAYIDASLIGGVLTYPNVGLYDVGSSDTPVMILMRAGETLEVIGQSAAVVLVRAREALEALKVAKASGRSILIDYLEPLHEAPVEE